jgi:hypothetical protein
MTKPLTFTALIQKEGAFTFIAIPGAPASHWGARPRYHVCGTIEGIAVRGCLGVNGGDYFLRLGAAWLRGTSIVPGVQVSVSLDLEGPQEDNLADDIVAALNAHPHANAFFDGLPTFYRKKYLRWIDSTKRSPDIRAQRINEMITLLANGQRER